MRLYSYGAGHTLTGKQALFMPYQFLIQTLDEGWQDRDFILLHACFQCLADCVEQENLLDGHIDWTHSERVQKAHRELTLLYEWWQVRVKTLASERGLVDTEAEQYQSDSQMLVRLIKVREFLWT